MIRDIVHSGITPEDWEKIRLQIKNKIKDSMGTFPDLQFDRQFVVHKKKVKNDLIFEHISFDVFVECTIYGSFVYDKNCIKNKKLPSILCLHGTDWVLGHRNVISPVLKPNGQYGIELAKNGYFVLTIDQFGFNFGGNKKTYKEKIDEFYSRFPEWSLDGIRLFVNQCALDLLSDRPETNDNIGCIGHSLGGRSVVYLAAFDDRIKAAVASTGVSPNITNLFRNVQREIELSPRLNAGFIKNGKPAFEYQEILALVAPKAILLIEPWNDIYNPYIETVFRCFEKARFVYALYNSDSKFSLITHGDGHNTFLYLRNFGYSWLDRFLKKKETIEHKL